jgi:hypothetical protein
VLSDFFTYTDLIRQGFSSTAKARRIAVIWLSLLNVGAPTIKHRTIENNLERSLPIPASFLVQEPRIGASPPIAAQESKA